MPSTCLRRHSEAPEKPSRKNLHSNNSILADKDHRKQLDNAFQGAMVPNCPSLPTLTCLFKDAISQHARLSHSRWYGL